MSAGLVAAVSGPLTTLRIHLRSWAELRAEIECQAGVADAERNIQQVSDLASRWVETLDLAVVKSRGDSADEISWVPWQHAPDWDTFFGLYWCNGEAATIIGTSGDDIIVAVLANKRIVRFYVKRNCVKTDRTDDLETRTLGTVKSMQNSALSTGSPILHSNTNSLTVIT